MADRRMFTKKVTDDDNFMSLSSSAQALYLHLSMSADDDGFCNQINISMFKAHASIQDLQALLEKRYLYQFENGVIVIKHWRMANALRKDRYTPTAFQEELSQLQLKDNGSYTFKSTQSTIESTQSDDIQTVTSSDKRNWLPDGCHVVAKRLPQDRLDKDRLDKDSIYNPPIIPPTGETEVKEKPKKERKRFIPPTVEEVEEYCRQRNNTIDAEEFVAFYDSKDWMVGKNKMVSWKSAIITWEKSAKKKSQQNNRDYIDWDNI